MIERPQLPTASQVADLPVLLEQVVPPEFEDANRHMNIRHYFTLQADAMRVWFRHIGYRVGDPDRAFGTFTLEQHLRYHREVLVGHEVAVHIRVLARTEKVVHQVGLMVNRTTGQIANTCEAVVGNIDMSTRRIAPFPAATAEVLDADLEYAAGLDWAPPRFGPVSL